MKAIVDRIENEIVVCQLEDETMLNIDILNFMDKPSEGDVVEFINDKWIIRQDETISRKQYIDKLIKDMWKK